MMYSFLTLDDETEITHSEFLPDERIKVYIEKPDEKDCFHHMTCYLPDYHIEEVLKYMKIIRSASHLIFEFSKESDTKIGSFCL